MKDSDIASLVFQQAGLTPLVTETDVVHDEEVSTIVQRETDIQLLKRLALRNGFECFVDGDTGYFGPPVFDDSDQPPLNVHAGDQTNVNRFSLEVNALAPANVAMSQLDHTTGEVLTATAEADQQPALGATRPASFLPAGADPGQVYVSRTVATGQPEMTALCQALYDQGEWFVTGEGEVAANTYGAVLLPRRTVVLNGVGETHSGRYYVTHVTHRFTGDGYIQQFRVKRNALVSDDAGAGGLLAGVL
jgi:phage protein D